MLSVINKGICPPDAFLKIFFKFKLKLTLLSKSIKTSLTWQSKCRPILNHNAGPTHISYITLYIQNQCTAYINDSTCNTENTTTILEWLFSPLAKNGHSTITANIHQSIAQFENKSVWYMATWQQMYWLLTMQLIILTLMSMLNLIILASFCVVIGMSTTFCSLACRYTPNIIGCSFYAGSPIWNAWSVLPHM